MVPDSFKEFYTGYQFEYKEHEYLFKTLKRQISSYLKETSQERLHGIFNKIFLLRKCIDKEHFYSVLLEGMNTDEKEKFLKFILREGFEFEDEVNDSVRNVWEHQLNNILTKYRR